MNFFLSYYSDVLFFSKQYRAIGNAVCPPLIAALAGAVLDRCPNLAVRDHDWLHRGQEIAVQLAMSAARSKPAEVPRGCLLQHEQAL